MPDPVASWIDLVAGRAMPPKKRNTPFKGSHEHEYALQIHSRDPDTFETTSVVCRFCQVFGREEKPGQKRAPANTIKYFRRPFRIELYKQHLESQHPTRWATYQASSNEMKLATFNEQKTVDNSVPVAAVSAARAVRANSEEVWFFDIDVDIVSVFVRELMSKPEWKHSNMFEPFDAFRPQQQQAVEVGGAESEAPTSVVSYHVQLKQVQLFKFVIGALALGASIRLAARQVLCARELLGPDQLSECDEMKVASFVRIAAAANLQRLREVLRESWGWSLVFDLSTVPSTSFFDVRVRFARGVELHCFHILCLPLLGSETGKQLFDVLRKTLDAICESWTTRLISICLDGALNTADQVRVMFSLLDKHLQAQNPARDLRLIHVWCGAHQLDLVVRDSLSAFVDDEFYCTLTAVVGYLRRQSNLANAMGSTCPKLVTTRWLSLARVLPWLEEHQCRVREYLAEEGAPSPPPTTWWIALLVLAQIVERIEATFKRLQHSALLMPQQQAALAALLSALRDMSRLRGPLTPLQLEQDEDCKGCEGDGVFDRIIVKRPFVVSKPDVFEFIRGCGSKVAISFECLGESERAALVASIGTLLLSLASGVASISPELDPSLAPPSLPPCLPQQLVKLSRSAFVDLIIEHRPRLELSFSEADIVRVEKEHAWLCALSDRDDGELREVLRTLSSTSGFEESWRSFRAQLPKLLEFAGGIASVHPTMARVERDTPSLINDERDALSLISLSLEGILHARQFRAVTALPCN